MNANEPDSLCSPAIPSLPGQSQVVYIRWPFRVLAGILAFAVFVPMLFVLAQTKPLQWSALMLVGWSTVVIAMLSLTGKPWPDWTAMLSDRTKSRFN